MSETVWDERAICGAGFRMVEGRSAAAERTGRLDSTPISRHGTRDLTTHDEHGSANDVVDHSDRGIFDASPSLNSISA